MRVPGVIVLAIVGLGAGIRLTAVEPGDRLQFADGFFARGLYDLAIQEYEALLKDSPDHPRADAIQYRIAESYRGLGKGAEADAAYGVVMARFPRSPYRFKAGLRKAEFMRDSGQGDAAVVLLRDMLKENPPGDAAAAALYMSGDILVRAGRSEEAMPLLAKVVSDHAATEFASYAMLALAGIYGQKPETLGQAADLYEKATANPATDRVGAEAFFQLGSARFRQGDYARSFKAFEQLLARYPGDPRAAESRMQAAWAAHNAGLYADGLRMCEAALAGEGPGAGAKAEWLYLKANCQRQLLKYDAAAETYAALLQEYPTHALASAAAYERAVCLFRMGRYRDAAQEGRQLKLTAENRKDAYWLLAESYAALGEDDGAIQYYKLLTQEFPREALASDARYRLAHLLRKRGDYGPAAELFETVAAESADAELAAQALFASAYCLSQMKKMPEAVRNWTALIQKYPQHPLVEEALYQKGVAEILLRRDEAALVSLRGLFQKFPQTKFAPESHYWIGILLQEAKRFSEAETEFRAALQSRPPEDVRQKVQLRLALALQRQGKADEAAGLLQGLLAEPIRTELTPDLLEWLAEHWIEKKAYANAAAAGSLISSNTTDATWMQIGWTLAGKAWRAQGKAAEAEAAFRKALATKSVTVSGAEAALGLGEILEEATNYAAAAEYFDLGAKMVADDSALPIRVRCYAGLGRVAREKGEMEAAAKYFMGVGVLFDDPEIVPQALYEAARAFRALGRKAEEEKALEELMRRYPTSRWATQARP